MDIDEKKKTLDLVWNDVYDLNVYVVNQLNEEILTSQQNRRMESHPRQDIHCQQGQDERQCV
jgi:hypothetical protein